MGLSFWLGFIVMLCIANCYAMLDLKVLVFI